MAMRSALVAVCGSSSRRRIQHITASICPWELHCNGAINNGVSAAEIRAIIHVVGIYCGVPQALECFRVARKVLSERGLLPIDDQLQP